MTGGRGALYTASWTNQSNATLTKTSIFVTLPPGWTLRSADPAVCTPPAANPADPIVVSCPRANLSSGATFTQQLSIQAAQATAESQAVATSFLQGDERASDPNQSHTDSSRRRPDRSRSWPAPRTRPVRAARSGTPPHAAGPG